MPYTTLPYSHAQQLIKPLDLIFFRGSDIVSNTIRIAEKISLGSGDFSHVGLVVTRDLLPKFKQLDPTRLYVLEATMSYSLMGLTDGVPNALTGKGFFGVQIRDLESVLTSYTKNSDAKVAWARLIRNPYLLNDQKKDVRKVMDAIMEKYGGRTFELNIFACFGTVVPCCRPIRRRFDEVIVQGHRILTAMNKKEDVDDDDELGLQTLFCSELLAVTFQKLELLPSSVVPSEVTPMDFLIEGTDKSLFLGEPIYLTN